MLLALLTSSIQPRFLLFFRSFNFISPLFSFGFCCFRCFLALFLWHCGYLKSDTASFWSLFLEVVCDIRVLCVALLRPVTYTIQDFLSACLSRCISLYLVLPLSRLSVSVSLPACFSLLVPLPFSLSQLPLTNDRNGSSPNPSAPAARCD